MAAPTTTLLEEVPADAAAAVGTSRPAPAARAAVVVSLASPVPVAAALADGAPPRRAPLSWQVPRKTPELSLPQTRNRDGFCVL